MKEVLAAILSAVLILCFCSCESNNSSSDNEISTATADTPKEKSDLTVFHMNTICQVGNDVYCTHDKGLYRSSNGGSWQQFVKGNVYNVFADSDTLYYIIEKQKNNNKYSELHSIKSDGSNDKLIISLDIEASDLTDILIKKDNLIYYSKSPDGLFVCNTETNTSELLAEGFFNYAFASGEKIFCLYEDGYGYNGFIPTCYDTSTKAQTTLCNSKVNESDSGDLPWYYDGKSLFFAIYSENKKSCDIYQTDFEQGTAKKVTTISTAHKMHLLNIIDNIAIYQDYDANQGAFSTYTQPLNGTAKQHKEINYSLKPQKDIYTHTFCTNSPPYYIIYNISDDTFRMADNIKNEYGTIYYNNKNSFFSSNDANLPLIQPLSLSKTLPRLEDLYSEQNSSPDSKNVRLKRIYSDEYGNIFKIPEILLDSNDAQSTNTELDTKDYDKNGQYYKTFQCDPYLSLYNVGIGESGGSSFSLYTFDTRSGTRLNKDEIIALVADDPDAFREQLKEELIAQQTEIYEQASYQMPKEDITYVTSDDNIDDMQFAYAGGNKLICVSTFTTFVGAEHSKCLFEFTYQP